MSYEDNRNNTNHRPVGSGRVGVAAFGRIVLAATFVSSIGTLVSSAVLQVSSTLDATDANPGNGVCETAPGNGVCTLRAAIQEANALAGADVMNVPAGTYTITRAGEGEDGSASGDLDINGALTIYGAGANLTVIDGNALDRVVDCCPSPSCNDASAILLSGLTIQNGLLVSSAGVMKSGGGIRNFANLTLSEVSVMNNRLEPDGIPNQFGGGISNGDTFVIGRDKGRLNLYRTKVMNNSTGFGVAGIASFAPGDVTIVESTISGNIAYGNGGGMTIGGTDSGGHLAGHLKIIRSTVSNNSAGNDGGGVRFKGVALGLVNSTISGNSASDFAGVDLTSEGSVEIVNSTIANNSSSSAGACAGICRETAPGGVVRIRNTIISGNSCDSLKNEPLGRPFVSSGYNFDTADTCDFTDPRDQPNTNPLLLPLASNGGPTQSHALASASPALDIVDPQDCPPTDQRGVARPAACGCDIGSYEASVAERATRRVTKVADTNDGNCSALDCSLREAVEAANANPDYDVIEVPAGTYVLTIPGALGEGFLTLTHGATLLGTGPMEAILDGQLQDRILYLDPQSPGANSVTLCGVTLRNASASGDGGAIYAESSKLTLIDVHLLDNRSALWGGGLATVNHDVLRVFRSRIERNLTLNTRPGGGLWVHGGGASDGPNLIVDSQIAWNTGGWGGGGVHVGGGTVFLGSSITNNTSSGDGGGVYVEDGAVDFVNTTISGNVSAVSGGGVFSWSSSPMTLTNTTIASNAPSEVGLGAGSTGMTRGSVFGTAGCSAPLTSSNHNLAETSTCLQAPQAGDLINVAAGLQPLADNGGGTLSHALQGGSPAVDAVAVADCIDLNGARLLGDQRGAARPFDGNGDTILACDTGAVEHLGACIDQDGDGFGAVGNPACPGGRTPDGNDADSACNVDCADLDGDGVPDVVDCAGGDWNVWGIPGEVRSLRFNDRTHISWLVPSSAGGGAQSVVFDTLRSLNPANFTTATCLGIDSTGTTAVDTQVPTAGQTFFYLVRAENRCPGRSGTLGTGPAGTERQGAVCE